MRTEPSIIEQNVDPATDARRTGAPYRRARAQTPLPEVLVVVALVAIEMAAALAVAAIFAPIAWPFS
jgi:hypothetical protein